MRPAPFDALDAVLRQLDADHLLDERALGRVRIVAVGALRREQEAVRQREARAASWLQLLDPKRGAT